MVKYSKDIRSDGKGNNSETELAAVLSADRRADWPAAGPILIFVLPTLRLLISADCGPEDLWFGDADPG